MAAVLVIGGLPGSGKTTVAEGLALRDEWELVSAGALFREMAAEQGLSLEAFGKLAEEDHTIDRRLDETVRKRVAELTAQGVPVVVEGRLQAHLLRREGVNVFAVWLEAPREVRAARIAGREDQTREVALQEMEEREASEARRYASIYGIDPAELSVFDLILPTTDRTPSEIVARIVEEAGS